MAEWRDRHCDTTQIPCRRFTFGQSVVPLTSIFIDLPCVDSVVKAIPVDQRELSLPDVSASKVIDPIVLRFEGVDLNCLIGAVDCACHSFSVFVPRIFDRCDHR